MIDIRRPDDMARINTPELAQAYIDEQIKAIKEQVGEDGKVLLALFLFPVFLILCWQDQLA